ncbi:MAG: alpha/beta hydrolase [Magnetococcales bacterium]|nr:alpha/beta hydrolase [Magnetococcales bacterium]
MDESRTGVPLFCHRSGTGPPLVGIAGFGCSHWLMQPLAAHLERSFTVWLPDNRGMGRSPKPSLPFDIDDLAHDILTLVHDRIGAPVTLLGVSMGGFIVQRLLTLAPNLFTAAAILCSTSAGPEFRPLFSFWSRTQMEKVLSMDHQGLARWILEPMVSPCLADYPEAYEYMLTQRLAHPEDRHQIMGQYLAMARFFATPLPLERIDVPVWIGCGERDPVFPVANSLLLAKRLPRSEWHIVPDTDHLFFVEKPAVVANALKEFLGVRKAHGQAKTR